MFYRISKLICLILLIAFVFTGCEQKTEEKVVTDKPEVQTLIDFVTHALPDYAAEAIDVTGGLEAWGKTKKMEFDCVVTFYQPDGSFYLTEQHHEIQPWSNSIRISAQEPQGKLVWQLTEGRFSVSSQDKSVDALPIVGSYRDFAEAILDLITGPIRLSGSKARFNKSDIPIKIEGLWYYPIERVGSGGIEIGPNWDKLIFYQNRGSSLIDMLWCAGVDGKTFLAVRGYHYRSIEKRGVSIPTKVEIFKTDAAGFFQQRLVNIDYHSLKSTKSGEKSSDSTAAY